MAVIFTQQFHIPSYAVGADNRLRLSALLQLQQEAGERQLAENGMSYNALVDKGVAFLVTRLCSNITRLPEMGEEVVLKTWHRDIKGVQFFQKGIHVPLFKIKQGSIISVEYISI